MNQELQENQSEARKSVATNHKSACNSRFTWRSPPVAPIPTFHGLCCNFCCLVYCLLANVISIVCYQSGQTKRAHPVLTPSMYGVSPRQCTATNPVSQGALYPQLPRVVRVHCTRNLWVNPTTWFRRSYTQVVGGKSPQSSMRPHFDSF